MKVLRQVRHHNVWFERIEMGMLGDRFIEMDESFHFDIRPLPAVPAADERMDGANKIGTHQPFLGVVRNVSKEEHDRETGAEFELLETSTNSPLVHGAGKGVSGLSDGRRNP
jgi:hypothetical protein